MFKKFSFHKLDDDRQLFSRLCAWRSVLDFYFIYFILFFHLLDISGRQQRSSPPSRAPQAQFTGTHFAGERGIYFQRHFGYEKESNRMFFLSLMSATKGNFEISESFLFLVLFSLGTICLHLKKQQNPRKLAI